MRMMRRRKSSILQRKMVLIWETVSQMAVRRMKRRRMMEKRTRRVTRRADQMKRSLVWILRMTVTAGRIWPEGRETSRAARMKTMMTTWMPS